jgi:hypothetical protein
MLLAEISGTTALLSTAFVLACAVTFIAFVVGAALLLRNSSRRTGRKMLVFTLVCVPVDLLLLLLTLWTDT